jgi:outer membrane lipoprotein-sorting protein
MGIERLLVKMIVRAKQDRQHENCEVQFSSDVPLGELRGVRIVITHLQKSEGGFFRAEIELETSNFAYLRYSAYDWPEEAGQPAPLLEEYIYQDVELNPGLADSAFDPDNPDYNYP